MCGITGIVNFAKTPVDVHQLVRATRTLTHRGPDEEGYFVNSCDFGCKFREFSSRLRVCQGAGNVGFGHRRLSIIDLASGQQPLTNPDKSLWITFNGEIYNYKILRNQLETKGYVFQTNSDTEVILYGYTHWGQDVVTRLRGMFAFAIWDEKHQEIFMARDRLGKKPLYYSFENQCLRFGSELKSLLALEPEDYHPRIDPTALSDYFSLLYVPGPKTIFRNLYKLPQAHWALISEKGIRIQSYWDLSFYQGTQSSQTNMEEDIRNLLDEAVKMRMVSEVPLGAFLSGGIDSSAIVAYMASASQEPVKTNSVSFSLASYDESRFAKKIADLYNTDHGEFHVTPDTVSVVEKLAWHYDEPFADASAVPTYYVSQNTRKRVTVSLSGDGGDESFAGYRRYYMDMGEHAVRSLFPRPLRRPVFGFLGRVYPKADYLPRIFRGKTFLSNVAKDPADAYYFSVSVVRDMDKPRLLNKDLVNALQGYETAQLFRDIYKSAPAEDHLSRIQYLDIKTYLCDDILTKVDRASMAASLEVRCPLLDHVFMEYAARMPSSMKLKGTQGKYILKKAMETHLPEDILYRKKMGFSMPVPEWMRTDLKDYARCLVMEGEASKTYLDSGFLKKMWKEHQQGLRNWATPLWSVMIFNLWYQQFSGRNFAGRKDLLP